MALANPWTTLAEITTKMRELGVLTYLSSRKRQQPTIWATDPRISARLRPIC